MATVQMFIRHTEAIDEQAYAEIGIVGGSEANTRAAIEADLDAAGITAAGGVLGKQLGIEYKSGGSYGSGRCGVSCAVEFDDADLVAVTAAIEAIYTARA